MAIIFRNTMKVSCLPVKDKLIISAEHFMSANVYRSPSSDITEFFKELSNLEVVLRSTGGHLILLGISIVCIIVGQR